MFYKNATLRDIISRYFKAKIDRTKEKNNEKNERFGYGGEIIDKASFFEEWHVHHVGEAEMYGQSLAHDENYYLFGTIAKDCEEILKDDFEMTLRKLADHNDIVIFVTDTAWRQFFYRSGKFKANWPYEIKQLNIEGFAGCYDLDNQQFPIFKIPCRQPDNRILILNKAKFGHIIQEFPINEGENERSIEDIFYINIQVLSENTELLEELIKKPPEWLQKIGDEQNQREYLQERVRIQILERFRFKKSPDFEGYCLFLNSDSSELL